MVQKSVEKWKIYFFSHQNCKMVNDSKYIPLSKAKSQLDKVETFDRLLAHPIVKGGKVAEIEENSTIQIIIWTWTREEKTVWLMLQKAVGRRRHKYLAIAAGLA